MTHNTCGIINIVIGDQDFFGEMCNVAVSVARSTIDELCQIQTPTITYILADNPILVRNPALRIS